MANGLQAKSRGCFWGVRGKKKQVKEKARGKLASLDWVATSAEAEALEADSRLPYR